MSVSPHVIAPRRTAGEVRLLPATYRHAVVWTAWLFAATVPLLNTVTLQGVGTISRATGIVFAGAGSIALVLERHRRPLHDAHWVALGFLGLAALSRMWSVNPTVTDERVFTLAQLVLTFVLLWEFCRSRAQVRGLLRAFAFGATVMCIQLLHGALTAIEEPTRYTVADAHPNSLAFVVSLAIPVAWYLAVTASTRTERVVLGLYPLLAVVSVVLTASRSALLVTGVALLVVPFSAGHLRVRGRLAGVALVAVAVVVALAVAPAKPLERLGTMGAEVESADLSGRGPLWQASARIIVHAPFVGVGLGGTSTVLLDEFGVDRGSHNTFLAVAVELGLVGLLLFLVLLVGSLLPALRARGPDAVLARVLGLTLVVGLLPRHWHLEKATWLVMALVLGIVVAQQDEAEGEPAS